MKNYGSKAGKLKHKEGNCKTSGSVGYTGSKSAQDDESEDFSTTDGEVIDSSAGTDAVRKGKGMFIGGYFVGILDTLSGVAATPFLRY